MEDYEKLLDSAYEKIKPTEECGRFAILKAEGMVEGNKTIISNFMQIVNCIRRQPEHLAKFIFKELAAPGEIQGDRLILIKKVNSQNINDKIKMYVEKYVLCPNCKKPDTELIEEQGNVFIRCLACGTRKPVA